MSISGFSPQADPYRLELQGTSLGWVLRPEKAQGPDLAPDLRKQAFLKRKKIIQLVIYDMESIHDWDKGNYAEKGPVASGPLGTGHC